MSNTILSLLADITKALESELKDPSNPKMESVVYLLVLLMESNQPVLFLPQVLKQVGNFLRTFQKVLFAPNTQAYSRDITLSVLKHANSSYKQLREDATRLIYAFAKVSINSLHLIRFRPISKKPKTLPE